ncbi:MAG TPA: MFS transporter [Pseudoxanthomonas sp.]|nr:MFS transporter [Pseudoxanthomonas sp.]
MSATQPGASSPGTRVATIGGATAWWVWILAVTFAVYLFSFQTGYVGLNANVDRDLGLSTGQVATTAAVYTWVFALCQLFGGALLDRLGARKVLPISIALVTLGIFVFANASSYGVVLLAQILIAIGSCTGFIGAGYIGAQWFGMPRYSVLFGLVQLVIAVASAFTLYLAAPNLSSGAWRALFTWTAIFGVVLFLLALMYLRNPAPVAQAPEQDAGGVLASVLSKVAAVAKNVHVWIAALGGAYSFGALLALGVVWMPKLLQVHGFSEGTSNFGAAVLWLGLAAGSAVVPQWSDAIRKRKLPIIVCAIVQLLALLALLYLAGIGLIFAYILCFLFGFANAAHMLAFSTAADVVPSNQLATSAALVNSIMFIVGALLMSRPGVRIGLAVEAGYTPASLPLAQYASLPIIIACVLALLIALLMRETYPANR